MTASSSIRVLVAAGMAAGVAACGSERSATVRTGETAASPVATTAASGLPATARISCDQAGTTVLTPQARPRPDGIHVEIENRASGPLTFTVESTGAGGRGEDAPVGRSVHVLDLPPGSLQVSCVDPSGVDPSEAPHAELEIVDSEAIWVPTTLSPAREGAVGTNIDYGADTEGEQGDSAAIARSYLARGGVLEGGDTVERAGYPKQDQPSVRLVREGQVVAVLEFARRGGGLLLEEIRACTGIGLG